MKESEVGKNIAGVLTTAQSHHPVFDLTYWMSLLPPQHDPSYGTSSVQMPQNFLENEALREKVRGAGVVLGDPRPVDLFFWSTQPAFKPWLTKFGGVPFRNKSKAWPTKNGILATFVAQICFRDSLDIFAYELPGDLLTVFSIREDVWGHDESDPGHLVMFATKAREASSYFIFG